MQSLLCIPFFCSIGSASYRVKCSAECAQMRKKGGCKYFFEFIFQNMGGLRKICKYVIIIQSYREIYKSYKREMGEWLMLSEKMKQTIAVSLSSDRMQANITVSPVDSEIYTLEQLKERIAQEKIVYGIDEKALQSIITEKRFYMDIPIARGKEPIQGEDGYYEYLFETNVDCKPPILKDGSIDYKGMREVPVVKEQQELAYYHAATNGVDGVDVLGQKIFARRGKDLLPLKGKGFVVSEDKKVYSAAKTGKVTLKGNLLEVNNILIIKEDVSIATGGVEFAGDIVIKGNVLTGAQVHANGNIEVNGCVEAARLVAKKNIVLKNGMQGNGKGFIQAGGNVSGKFFEQVTIEAKGNVSANALMHCNIQCEESINISGKFGIIVGGKVKANRQIDATMIGNMKEVKTVVEVGTGENLYVRLEQLEEKSKEVINDMEKLKSSAMKIEELLKVQQDNEKLKKTKMTVMRSKIEKEAVLTDLQREKNAIIELLSKIANARVIVRKSIYPGVILTVNGVQEMVKSENYNVYYQKKGIELEFLANI